MLGDGLAHFGSDQFREVAFNIIACFTSNAGCALGKGIAALMRLENGFLDCQGSLALRTNYRHGLLLNLIRVENSKQLSKSTNGPKRVLGRLNRQAASTFYPNQ